METLPPLRMPPVLGYTLLETLWQDKDLALCRGRRELDQAAILLESTLRIDVEPRVLEKLERGFSLRDELDPTWALSPIGRDRADGRPYLVFEDPGGDTLSRLLGVSVHRDPRIVGEDRGMTLGAVHRSPARIWA